MIFKCSILVIYTASFAYSAGILAIMPTASYSHQVAFFDLWEQLSLRGHKVTVITTDPQGKDGLPNLTEIDIHWSYQHVADISSRAEKTMTMWNMHSWFHNISYFMSHEQLSCPEIQDLIHDRRKNFDVLLLESFYPEFIGFAEIYNCPIILINSLDALADIHRKIGNVDHPVLNPHLLSEFQPPLNFRERVTSYIYTLYATLFYNYISYPAKEKLLRTFFNSTSTINELLYKVDMLFLSINPVIQSIRTIGPTTINVGGLRTLIAKPLTKDLQEYLDSATDGFIYFSLGSNVKSKELQAESLNSILEALGELPYKVLWKFEADEEALPNKPGNVKLIKWAPQLGVLSHPYIKAFVTQGGLQSMEEAIHNEVPCVVIPFFADQQQNAKLMTRKGFAVSVERHPYIKKDELKNAIMEVINYSKYKKSISRINRLSLDTPMTGLEKAIWWTEYVIRNKGAKELRNPAADLPLYQYYLLDVLGFLIFVIVAISYIVFILLRAVYKFIVARLSSIRIPAKKIQ